MPIKSGSRLERPLPQNIEAERALLGAVLLDNTQLAPLAEKIKPSDFFQYAHAQIFRAMLALEEGQQPIDLITLQNYLQLKNEMEAIGGAGYVSSLIDGVPRISNVEHYAEIVHEKAVLRNVIHGADALQRKAFDGLAKPQDLQFEIDVMLQSLSNGHRKKAEAIDGNELLLMDLKPRDYVISPVFPTQGIVMCHAWRGTGKTYLGLELAHSIAMGPRPVFSWNVPRKRKVLYVDGEMPDNALQERYRKLIRGDAFFDPHSPTMGLPEKGFMAFLNRDHHNIPHISSSEGQRYIESFLSEDMVLFLDNLTSLAPGGKEGQEEWFPIQEWLLRLRHRGIHTWFFHHSGKSGAQRGASGREDVIDSSIQLRHPHDYNEAEGLRAEVHMEKMRSGPQGETAWPFEISIEKNEEDQSVTLVYKPLKKLTEQRAFEMLDAGMNPRDIAEDLHLTRYQAYRLQKKWKIAKVSS